MSKVISGFAKGMDIDVFPQRNMRPTSCRAKEALFDIIQFDIKDKIFIDLFSGTGQIGIEALSRGARKVIFVDHSVESCKILKKNLKKIIEYSGKKLNVEIYILDYLKFSNFYPEKADFLFVDAPFMMQITYDIFKNFVNIVKKNGVIITETFSKNKQIEKCENFYLIKKYIYGKITLNFYKNLEKENVNEF